MTIYFADFDNKLVDALVEAEATDHWHRTDIVIEMIIDAFIEIAGENVYLENSDDYEELMELAIDAGNDWLTAFGDTSTRRAILFRMFPKAEALIAKIEPNEVFEDEYFTGDNECTIYNVGSSNPSDDYIKIIKNYLNKNNP